ncbi:MAG: hypothetical protein ACRC0S_02185 [Fusobacteriaceae bacterium]
MTRENSFKIDKLDDCLKINSKIIKLISKECIKFSLKGDDIMQNILKNKIKDIENENKLIVKEMNSIHIHNLK